MKKIRIKKIPPYKEHLKIEIDRCKDVENEVGSFDWERYDESFTVEELKRFVSKLEEMGVNRIKLLSTDYGSIQSFYYTDRMETDEEYNTRVEEYERNAAIMMEYERQRELKELERLQKKYKTYDKK